MHVCVRGCACTCARKHVYEHCVRLHERLQRVFWGRVCTYCVGDIGSNARLLQEELAESGVTGQSGTMEDSPPVLHTHPAYQTHKGEADIPSLQVKKRTHTLNNILRPRNDTRRHTHTHLEPKCGEHTESTLATDARAASSNSTTSRLPFSHA